MAAGSPAFYLEELQEFDIEQLRRICGYLQIHYVKKTSKKKLIDLIWDEIKPPPVASNIQVVNGIEQPVSVKLVRMMLQAQMEGDKPNEW